MSNDDKESRVDGYISSEDFAAMYGGNERIDMPILINTINANGQPVVDEADPELQDRMLASYDDFIAANDWGDRSGYHGRMQDPEMELLFDIIVGVVTTYLQEIDAELKENPELASKLGYSSVEDMIIKFLDPAERQEMEAKAKEMILSEKQAFENGDIGDAFEMSSGNPERIGEVASNVDASQTHVAVNVNNTGAVVNQPQEEQLQSQRTQSQQQAALQTTRRGGYC